MDLTFLRHTQPKVDAGVCYGRTNLELAESFAEEAAQVVMQLPAVDLIVSSPLQRCLRLAEYIAEQRNLSLKVEDRFQEMDFGAWEGKPWKDISKEELDLWAGDFLNARPHGGESVAMLRARTHEALAAWRQPEQHILVVTHLGVIKTALAKGTATEDFAINVSFGGIIACPPAHGDKK